MGSEEGISRDAIIGIVGAVVLISAMGGVFFYERAQFDAYEVSWSAMEVDSSTQTATLTEGASESWTFAAETGQMVEATVDASWDGDATVSVSIEGSGEDLTGSEQASSSPLDTDIVVQDGPSISSVTARSEEDATAQLNDAVDWRDASGDWTVTVTLEEAPEDLPGVEPAERSIEVTFAYTEWVSTLSVA